MGPNLGKLFKPLSLFEDDCGNHNLFAYFLWRENTLIVTMSQSLEVPVIPFILLTEAGLSYKMLQRWPALNVLSISYTARVGQ